jgi:hypothetical protein
VFFREIETKIRRVFMSLFSWNLSTVHSIPTEEFLVRRNLPLRPSHAALSDLIHQNSATRLNLLLLPMLKKQTFLRTSRKVRVTVTFRLAVCRQLVRLGAKPLESHDQ